MTDVRPRGGGPYSLYCYDCDTWVPNTANNEMADEGCFAHSHWCGRPVRKPGIDLRKAIKQAIAEGYRDISDIAERVEELGFEGASMKRLQNIAKSELKKVRA